MGMGMGGGGAAYRYRNPLYCYQCPYLHSQGGGGWFPQV